MNSNTNTLFRNFINLIALLLLAAIGVPASAGQSSASDAEARLGWNMAIHSLTYKNFNFFDAMDKTASLGLHHMSFSQNINLEGTNAVSILALSAEQIKMIKDRAAAKGITFVNAYVPLPADEAKCRQSFEFARKMGLDIVVGEPAPEALDTVEKLCKEYKIKVAIHDHPKPSHYWNPQTVLDAIKGRSPLMGACADTGHWARSGLDTVDCLKQLEGHIFCLHFKDLNEKVRAGHDVPWGTGVGDAKAMMAELKRQGFHGSFCVEYEYHFANSTPEIAECAKFFRSNCVELARQ